MKPYSKSFQLTSRIGLLALGSFAALVLIGAFSFQYLFDAPPCELCYRQRYPFYAAFFLCLVAYFTPQKIRSYALLLLALIFLISIGLALHHTGVEWGLWPGPTDCSGGGAPTPLNAADLLAQLETTKLVDCSVPSFFLLGLSLAEWNVLISLGATIMSVFFWIKTKVSTR